MAALYLEGGRRYGNVAAIAEALALLGVTLNRWTLPQDATTRALLDAPVLDETQQAALLAAVEDRFDELKRSRHYTARDLVVLHESQAGFAELAAKFARTHTHADDEVRFILDGRGYFGLVDGNGRQVLLEVEAGEYINVPAGAEHWFELGSSKRVKAVRYFTEAAGWGASFTDRPVSVRPPAS